MPLKFMVSFMRRFIRHLTLIFIAGLFLQGCSAVRLGYGNADSLARWWIDQYIDMSPEQDALARERLARFHSWHRKTQLPDYVSVLRQGQKFITGQPSAADALVLGDGIIRRGRTLAEQATPDIAEFLATVSPAQIERMAGRLAEKNADYAREAQLADGENGQRKARYKRLLERAEYWFDSFSAEQKTALRQMIDGQTAGSQFWYEERLRRQRDWLDLVRQVQRERPPRERIMQMLSDYAARFDMPGDPARLAHAVALRRAAAELAVAIHAMTSPAQRAHAEHKLGELIRDFTELSQEG
ncbi:MAG: DUF6279 family lipoprotein [Sulfuritalea sp.]|nr:DUF6279 family lipoprotein [Sulfuritalea sp.]